MQSNMIISTLFSDKRNENIFPNMSGTVWMWSYDGKHPRGILEFLADGKIKYRFKKREGGWTITHNGSILEANFGGENHFLSYVSQYEIAILRFPVRDPRSLMFLFKGTLGRRLGRRLGRNCTISLNAYIGTFKSTWDPISNHNKLIYAS